MTAGQIIAEMYESREVNDCFRKIKAPKGFLGSRDEFQGELKSETFRILCERDPCDIVRMYKSKELRFFIVRIIFNLCRHTNNVIHVNYLSNNTVTPDDIEDRACNGSDPDMELYRESATVLDWMRTESSAFNYYANIITLYAQLGSIRAVATQTGIPPMSVHQAVVRAKEIIKQKVYEHC